MFVAAPPSKLHAKPIPHPTCQVSHITHHQSVVPEGQDKQASKQAGSVTMTSKNREHTCYYHEEDEFEEADVDPDDRILQNDQEDRDDRHCNDENDPPEPPAVVTTGNTNVNVPAERFGDYFVRNQNTGTFNVEYGRVDRLLLAAAKAEFQAVVRNVHIGTANKLAKEGQELAMQLFMLYFDPMQMLKWCSNYSNNPEETFYLVDIYAYIHAVLVAMLYNTSISHLFMSQTTDFYRELFITPERFHTIHAYLNRSRRKHDGNNSGEWDAPIHINQDIRTIFDAFGRRCANICFIKGKTMLGLDDDMWRLRSKASEGLGLPVVHHAAVSVTTGLYCGGYVQHKGETTDDCVLNVQRVLCGVISNDAIDLKGTTFFMDRGYGGVDGTVTTKVIENGGLVHGTAKRDASIPFLYGESKRKILPTQKKIQEEGTAALYGATKTIRRSNGTPVRCDAIGYRNGLGRVVLMRSNLANFGVGEVELVPTHVARKKKKKESEDNDMLLRFETSWVVIATTTQERPEWFYARKFRITETSAHLLFKQMLRYVSATNQEPEEDYHIAWCNRLLAIVGLSDTTRYTSDNEETLMGKGTTANDLLEIIKNYNTSLPAGARSVARSGTRKKLVERIIEYEMPIIVPDRIQETPLLVKLLQTWMMQPFKGSDATYISSHNKANVRQNIPNFIKSQSEYDIKLIREYGLLYCKENTSLAFSPDGICVTQQKSHEGYGYRYTCFLSLLEIKTRVTPETIRKEYDIMTKMGLFVTINLSVPEDDKIFHKVVPDIGHRMQILHGMGCSGLRHAFYVVAKPTAIIRVVLVRCAQELHFGNKYQRTIKRILVKEELEWINGGDTVPAVNFEQFPKELKYCVDQHSIEQTFQICRNLDLKYTSQGLSIPECHRILPAAVALWNKCKGPIDVYSGYLKNVSLVTSKTTNIGAQWMHIIQTASYNAYQTQVLLDSHSILYDDNECGSWSDYVEHRRKIKRKKSNTYRMFTMLLIYSFECYINHWRNKQQSAKSSTADKNERKVVKRRRSSSFEQKQRQRNRNDHVLETIKHADAQGKANIGDNSDSDSGNESANFNEHNVTLTKNNLQSSTKMRGMAKFGADTSSDSDYDSDSESEWRNANYEK